MLFLCRSLFLVSVPGTGAGEDDGAVCHPGCGRPGQTSRHLIGRDTRILSSDWSVGRFSCFWLACVSRAMIFTELQRSINVSLYLRCNRRPRIMRRGRILEWLQAQVTLASHWLISPHPRLLLADSITHLSQLASLKKSHKEEPGVLVKKIYNSH